MHDGARHSRGSGFVAEFPKDHRELGFTRRVEQLRRRECLPCRVAIGAQGRRRPSFSCRAARRVERRSRGSAHRIGEMTRQDPATLQRSAGPRAPARGPSGKIGDESAESSRVNRVSEPGERSSNCFGIAVDSVDACASCQQRGRVSATAQRAVEHGRGTAERICHLPNKRRGVVRTVPRPGEVGQPIYLTVLGRAAACTTRFAHDFLLLCEGGQILVMVCRIFAAASGLILPPPWTSVWASCHICSPS